MKKSFAFIIALLFYATLLSAQTKQARSSEWRKEMREYKHSLRVKEMGLSGESKEKFIKLYSAMEDEIYSANSEARLYASKVASNQSPSDAEFEKAAEGLIEAKTKEAQIESSYFEKFKSFLSKKQLFQLKNAENKFAKSMISHRKKQQ